MSQRSRQIKAANQILRDLDAVFPGYTPPEGKFQWKWSEDLWSFVPEYRVSDYENWDPQPVMEYRCQCGVDRRVHEPHCSGLTVAKVKLKKVSTFGLEGEFQSYKNVWVLCHWEPPIEKILWVEAMGTDEDYPANGRYLPVHRGPMCIVMPKGTDPKDYARASQVVVCMMQEHAAKWQEEIEGDKAKQARLLVPVEDKFGNVVREADKTSPYWEVKERLKNRMRTFNPDGTVGYSKEIVTNAG